jgi:hypothetical protein
MGNTSVLGDTYTSNAYTMSTPPSSQPANGKNVKQRMQVLLAGSNSFQIQDIEVYQVF